MPELAEKKYSESIQQSLIEILKNCENEDMYIRQRMLRECKQYELYWHGFQYIFWDERVQDFRIPTHDVMEQVASREEVKFIYDYVVNIFKAHGLSIIAALSAEVPNVAFSPYDADNQKDIIAARQAESLGKVISKYNKSKLLFYHALFTLYTNHFVAAYNYYERDKKYGELEIPKYKTETTKLFPDTYNCLGCGFQTEGEIGQCPECGNEEIEKTEGEMGEIPVQVGSETIQKGMEKIRVRGTLNVKVPTWASDQEACGYIIDYYDQHFAYLRHIYPDIDRTKISLMGNDNFERIARMPSIGRLYTDTYLQHLLTLKRVWLRPWMFESLDKKECDELKKEFPTGVYFAVIDGGGDVFAEAREECLDDHWTISKGDLSRAVHGDPLCKPLLPLQDLENMVTNLLVESLEHSVPSSFADPEIIDFDLYSKQEVLPGALYPLKNSINPTRSLQDYFYTLKTSTLPKEGVDFDKIVESKSQFVVGAFPSIFGGPQTEGSKTLGEYQESRNYALQRLSIPYQLLYFWWSDLVYKAVKEHIEEMVENEMYPHPISAHNRRFENVHLYVDAFKSGRFGLLIPESSVDLPTSYSQKRGTIERMVQLNSDTINQFLFSPENRHVTLRFLGIEELNDLDSAQAVKQLLELEDLLKSEPTPDETGRLKTSIPIEPEIDDHEIHLRVIRVFLCSPSGQAHKKENPDGYQNVLLHAQEHYVQLQLKMAMAAPSPAVPNPKPKINQPVSGNNGQ